MKPFSKKATINELQINYFIKYYSKLKSKYTHLYDYQHTKCEDPELIKSLFKYIQKIIQKYGILEQDIYNIDKTSFQMDVASTIKVIYSLETKDSHAKLIQPENYK